MNTFKCIFIIAVIITGTSACTIRHNIEEDYPQYLINNTGESMLPKTDKASEYFLTENTRQYSYEFRAITTGYANLWVVEFGKMLDDTMMSRDVQEAFGTLQRASDTSGNAGNLLIFDLEKYSFEEFGAQIFLKISLSRGGETMFSKTYIQNGKTQGGKMFWGGAFAQKNAVQQSTKLAVDDILRELISDLNTQVK